MKILTLDIETSPNVAYSWGLFNQNIGLSQLVKPSEVMCFAAKWHHRKSTEFYSVHWDGKDSMLKHAHQMLSDADAVVHYNGTSFDVPHLHREFALAGMPPPAPFAQIDLLRAVRKNFRFTSNKLDHVASQFGLGNKVAHEGFGLWVKTMAGEDAAWRRFRKYCKGDVVLTEQLYDRLLPWIAPHPSVPLHDGVEDGCPNCGSASRQQRGYAYTAVSRYVRYSCNACGRWYRGRNCVARTSAR